MPESYDDLDAELRALADELRFSAGPAWGPESLPPASSGPAAASSDAWVDELAGAVLVRVADEPVPGRPSAAGAAWRRTGAWLRSRWRAAVAFFTAVVVIGALAPPVRATVAELFGFGGVVVRREPGPVPSGTPAPPPAVRGTTLEQARRLIAFEPLLPSALGEPDGVDVSGDREVLSLSWTVNGRTVRLDEFGSTLDPRFWKAVRNVEYIQIGDDEGLWFPDPHEVVTLDDAGNQRREPPRLAGPTLVWEHGPTTLRLEGLSTFAEASALAATIR